MAITTNQSIRAMLKVWYRDGVENLMFRNSPLLRKLTKTRVEGKSQNFSAMYGRGGAVGGNFLKALANAVSVSKAVEFSVEPGQVFSVYTMNSKEVQASLSKRGAYMKVAGAKMFAASEGFRKTMACALYGRGYGELAVAGVSKSATQGTELTLEVPTSAAMSVDPDTKIEVKENVTDTTVKGVLRVVEINGNTLTLMPETTFSIAETDILCLEGSVDENGNPVLPIGLSGWLPIVAKRAGAAWNTYISKLFCEVNRKIAPDRLAGAFVDGSAETDVKTVIEKLMMKCRRQGSMMDLIVMSDEVFLKLSEKLATTNTYWTGTNTKERRDANIGFNAFSASFSTNYVENIIDDPYCPKGTVYVLDSSAVEFWSYTNTDKINDGIDGNNAGKQDPMTMDGEGQENRPYGLIIDDYLNVEPGTATVDGPAMNVTLMCFGSFVVTNPSVCGVAILPESNDVGLVA